MTIGRVCGELSQLSTVFYLGLTGTRRSRLESQELYEEAQEDVRDLEYSNSE